MITNPYGDITSSKWLRGNLHTHTTRSDGSQDPGDVVTMYADAGYDFLAMTDHDIWTTPDELSELPSGDMLLLSGNEITRAGSHVVHVQADALVNPHWDRQQVINDINRGEGFAIVAHPNFKEFNHCPLESLFAWSGYVGIEIYNGVVSRGTGGPYATIHWDRLLSSGRRVWGYAHDDFHDAGAGDLGRGWNVVLAREKTEQEIFSALREGRFYASTGVIIANIAVKGRQITIETENADRIVAQYDNGCRLAVVDEPVATIDVPENISMTYVRIECWGRGEQFAWTQPFWIDG